MLKHLDLKDRLTARSVCRAFAAFSPGDQLQLEAVVTSHSRAQSLHLFVARHALTTDAVLAVSLRRGKSFASTLSTQWIAPCIQTVLGYDCLRSLDISFWLDGEKAEHIIRAAPSQLTSLALHTTSAIVSDSAYLCAPWSRFESLQKLILDLEGKGLHHPSGLASLSALSFLSFTGSDPGVLYAEAFGLPKLHSLAVAVNPFTGRLNLANFPSLQEIQCLGLDPGRVDWLHWQPFERLTVQSSAAFLNWTCASLHCKSLHLKCDFSSFERSFRISWLAAMPLLQSMQLTAGDQDSCDVYFTGSWHQYDQVLKRIAITAASDVSMYFRTTALRYWDENFRKHINIPFPLRANGHFQVCQCQSCNADVHASHHLDIRDL